MDWLTWYNTLAKPDWAPSPSTIGLIWRILYPEFRDRGWQIGSGSMESQCRVVPDRVKGPGKRWDADNAEAVMALEALHQSRQWTPFWKAALN